MQQTNKKTFHTCTTDSVVSLVLCSQTLTITIKSGLLMQLILPEDYPLREEMVACYTPLSLHNTVQQTRVHRPPQYTG